MTLGELRVRVDFNVANGQQKNDVTALKIKHAELIDLVEGLRTKSGERNRLCSLAQTKLEEAAMFAVKAATHYE